MAHATVARPGLIDETLPWVARFAEEEEDDFDDDELDEDELEDLVAPADEEDEEEW
jgi:hypothetical protein